MKPILFLLVSFWIFSCGHKPNSEKIPLLSVDKIVNNDGTTIVAPANNTKGYGIGIIPSWLDVADQVKPNEMNVSVVRFAYDYKINDSVISFRRFGKNAIVATEIFSDSELHIYNNLAMIEICERVLGHVDLHKNIIYPKVASYDTIQAIYGLIDSLNDKYKNLLHGYAIKYKRVNNGEVWIGLYDSTGKIYSQEKIDQICREGKIPDGSYYGKPIHFYSNNYTDTLKVETKIDGKDSVYFLIKGQAVPVVDPIGHWNAWSDTLNHRIADTSNGLTWIYICDSPSTKYKVVPRKGIYGIKKKRKAKKQQLLPYAIDFSPSNPISFYSNGKLKGYLTDDTIIDLSKELIKTTASVRATRIGIKTLFYGFGIWPPQDQFQEVYNPLEYFINLTK